MIILWIKVGNPDCLSIAANDFGLLFLFLVLLDSLPGGFKDPCTETANKMIMAERPIINLCLIKSIIYISNKNNFEMFFAKIEFQSYFFI